MGNKRMEAAGVEPAVGRVYKVLKDKVNSVQTLIRSGSSVFYVLLWLTTCFYRLSLILITKAITVNYA